MGHADPDLHRVNTISGSPTPQSLEAFTAARVRGIPARLVEFENEAHQVFRPQNSLVWNREFFGWLDKYVK